LNYLSAENISKSFGIKELFHSLTFGVNKGQKVAFLAQNGAGKSTLFKCLLGRETLDTGDVSFRKGIHVSFLGQEHDFSSYQEVMDVVLDVKTGKMAALKGFRAALGDDKLDMDEALGKMESQGAWELEAKIEEILSKLKLKDINQDLRTFSGGQVKRLALAQVLLEEPDFLLLDEPTNHLDLEMIEWLENYLSKESLTILMITHDRYFLETVCDEILELHQGTLHKYKGNYSYYLEKKAEREEIDRVNLGKAKNLMKKELIWLRRQPKARGTKSKSRISAFDDIKKDATVSIGRDDIEIKVKMERLGTKIIEMHKVSKRYDKLVILNQLQYVFKRKERLGVIGKNGSGKSTFLNILSGAVPLDAGKLVIGETIKIGYYTQKGLQLKEDKRVIEVIRDYGDFIPLAKGRKLMASQLLEQFLFDKDQQWQYVSTLSGGERKRLYLLTILIQNPNFLILDEPTNDLDIYTLNVLEDYLQEFEGCIIVVTHDRYFMDKLTDHLFVFEGDGVIKDFNGNYSDYLKSISKLKVEKQKIDTAKAKPRIENKQVKKHSYKDKMEFETLEKEMALLETRKEELELIIANPGEAGDNLESLLKEFGSLKASLESKSERWFELAEKIE
jgi:ABC transport system ATP-binding/permease protein